MRYPQVLQLPIFNDSLKVNIDDGTRPQMFPKLLLQVSVRELHKIIVSEAYDDGIK